MFDKYHPDHNPGKEAGANEKFKGINEVMSIGLYESCGAVFS
jgi:DnaJ-class molecular chaperone